ncbi:DOPA-like domain-containing protein [Blastocladiella britannica]|nr:DOPA-like domain-containing protein [Blastocladiella britannica]
MEAFRRRLSSISSLFNNRTMSTSASLAWPTPITKYDVHIYWLPANQRQKYEASALLDRIAKQFPHLWQSRMHDRAIGPHPMPMAEIDVSKPEDFVTFVPWMAMNHGSLSVLIHPHTDDAVLDHTTHALWLGQPLPLDTDMLRAYQDQLNERDRWEKAQKKEEEL